ncbi:MAG: hypothetical protein ACF8XB_06505 [Planctomycetota bacterium JB042]
MSFPLSSWILLGALAASLLFPPFPRPTADGGAAGAAAGTCAPAEACVAWDDLTDDEASRLRTICESACAPSDETAALIDRLADALGADVVDEDDVRALAGRLGERRRETTVRAVLSLIEVRSVLGPDEVAALLRCATAGPSCTPR